MKTSQKKIVTLLLMFMMISVFTACNEANESKTDNEVNPPEPTEEINPPEPTEEINPFEDIYVGKELSFGKFERGSYDYKEDVIWVVLSIEKDKALLISKYAIDAKRTTSIEKMPDRLNLIEEEMFNEKEKELIIFRTVNGVTSKNRLFLLDTEEVEQYMPGTTNKLRLAAPTAYAESEGVKRYNTNFCNWILSDGSWVGGQLGNPGKIINSTKPDSYYGIRPAIWVSIT